MKRRLLTGVAVFGAVLALIVLPLQSAGAWITWCEDDPVLLIDGNRVSVVVRVPASAVAEIPDGANIVVNVLVPNGVDASVVSEDGLRYPDGTLVSPAVFSTTTIQVLDTKAKSNLVQVVVTVPTTGASFNVAVDIATPKFARTVKGVAGQPVVAIFNLGR